jgi:hypothetical protein
MLFPATVDAFLTVGISRARRPLHLATCSWGLFSAASGLRAISVKQARKGVFDSQFSTDAGDDCLAPNARAHDPGNISFTAAHP